MNAESDASEMSTIRVIELFLERLYRDYDLHPNAFEFAAAHVGDKGYERFLKTLRPVEAERMLAYRRARVEAMRRGENVSNAKP